MCIDCFYYCFFNIDIPTVSSILLYEYIILFFCDDLFLERYFMIQEEMFHSLRTGKNDLKGLVLTGLVFTPDTLYLWQLTLTSTLP